MFAVFCVFLILLIYLTLVTLYLVVTTVGAYFFRESSSKNVPCFLSLGVVIPAYNEEALIAETLRSVQNAHYPKDLLKIFVIADNCSDRTEEIAREFGVTVMTRTDPDHRGKGQALDDFFSKSRPLLQDLDLDAVVIVDADAIVHPRFLEEISCALMSDPSVHVDVVQGHYTVSNPKDSWLTALTAAAFYIFNHLKSAGRDRLGASAGLKGNGMAFRTGLLLEYGWPCHSIAEDVEMTLFLLQNGYRVKYHPKAIVYSEMPLYTAQAESQRKRWEMGRWGLLRKQFVPLLQRFVRKRDYMHLDALLDLVTPPMSLLFLFHVVVLCAISVPWPIVLFNLGGLLFYVFSGLALARAPLFVWGALLCTPLYVLFKMTLYVKSLFVKDAKLRLWTRTPRVLH